MDFAKGLFLGFSVIKMASLGFILYFVLSSFGTLGLSTRIVLSLIFPVFTFAIEYMFYSKEEPVEI